MPEARTPGQNPVLRYRLGPFEIETELLLPELRPATGRKSLRLVRIGAGVVPAGIEGALLVDPACSLSSREWLLDVPQVAKYYVRDGCEVIVEAAVGAQAADVRIYLLGSVFGVLCYQNDLLPLHASAVEHEGRVTAFLGESGAGKSTLAVALSKRGHTVVSDDICLLEHLPEGGWRVHPVAGWLKLWRETLDRVGETFDESNRVLSTQDKYRIFLGSETESPLMLANLAFLDRPEDVREPGLEGIGNAEAASRLMSMVYLPYYLMFVEGMPGMFRRCAQVVGSAQMFRLIAPRGWDRFPALLDVVEAGLLMEPAVQQI